MDFLDILMLFFNLIFYDPNKTRDPNKMSIKADSTNIDIEHGAQHVFTVGTEIRICWDQSKTPSTTITLGNTRFAVTKEKAQDPDENFPDSRPVCAIVERAAPNYFAFYLHTNLKQVTDFTKIEIFPTDYLYGDLKSKFYVNTPEYTFSMRYRETNGTIPANMQPEYVFTRLLYKGNKNQATYAPTLSILNQIRTNLPIHRHFRIDHPDDMWQIEVCIWRFFNSQSFKVMLTSDIYPEKGDPEIGLEIRADLDDNSVSINMKPENGEWPERGEDGTMNVPYINSNGRNGICLTIINNDDDYDIKFTFPKSDRRVFKKHFKPRNNFVKFEAHKNTFFSMRIGSLDATQEGWSYYQDPINLHPEFRQMLVEKKWYRANLFAWPQTPLMTMGH